MVTALTVQGNFTDASTTLSTAQKAYTDTSGVTTNSKATTIGTSTGWGEIWSQGTASAWPAAGSAPADGGHGWLYDSTALENQTIVAGNWSAIFRLFVSTGTASANLQVLAYKRSSGGVLTLIATINLTGQSFTTVAATYTFGTGSGAATAFVTGDKLYYRLLPNITVNGMAAGASMKYAAAITSGAGKLQNAELSTPGFVPSAGSILYVPHRGIGRIQ